MNGFFDRIKSGVKDFRIDMNNFSAFLTAIVFGVTGAFVLYVTVAESAGLSTEQMVSWVMTGSAGGAIATIILGLYFKQPIVILPSLPALIVMGTMFASFSLSEMVFGYLVASVCVFILGYFKIIGKIGKVLPVPIIMAMIAGVFMSYGVKMVNGVLNQPLVGLLIIASYLITSAVTKKVPPLLSALVVGAIATIIFSPIKIDAAVFGLYPPLFITPKFNPDVLLSVSFPLVLLVVADTLKGFGVLSTNDYDVPLNTNSKVAGIVSLITAFSLNHAVSMAGPVTAIVAGTSAGNKERRYVSSVLTGFGMLVAGLLAGYILPLVSALPGDIIAVITGLAMLGLFTSSLEMAFGTGKFLKGAFASFIVGLSGLELFGIGAPVWAIVAGVIVSLMTERADFK
ncbi:MAG: benzoate/H(+) symporter BenE family transporter [Lachnospiraceae bacterium]|jgi:benzoate membrane transport protein|nr:benzoate/H(+) symporter BenE family transporter [Lachnospiraceae bacterium]